MLSYILLRTSVELVDDRDLGKILVLYHEYDNDYLMFKGTSQESLQEIRGFLLEERNKIYKELVNKIDDTNRYNVGKVSVQGIIAS